MSDKFGTILIIGATSGLGEGIARRFHAQGKKVIVTGRRQDRLDVLEKELPGLSTQRVSLHQWIGLVQGTGTDLRCRRWTLKTSLPFQSRSRIF